MLLSEIMVVVAAATALAALAGWLVYRYLVEFMLIHRGTVTRGTVVRAVELGNGTGRSKFIVSYVFAAGSVDGNAPIYHGKQLMTYSFQPKDMVVVRFWPGWPRINLIVDRVV